MINDTFLDLVEDFWQEKGKLHRNSKFRDFIEDEIWLKGIGLSDKESMIMWLVDHAARTGY